MKQQLVSLSPHQNGKVFGILFAVSSLFFVIPFVVVSMFAAPGTSSPPLLLVVLFPFVYLVLGYLMVAVACLVYNQLFKYIGGIEYESQRSDA